MNLDPRSIRHARVDGEFARLGLVAEYLEIFDGRADERYVCILACLGEFGGFG